MFDFNSKQKLNESNPTEISVKKKQQIEYMPLGKIFVQRGHTVFEIETTGEIREAEYAESYKIISPQEEPEQETLEEATEKLSKNAYKKHSVKDDTLSLDEQIQRSGGFIVGFKEGMKEGAKWQSERMYSEEDLIEDLLQAKGIEPNDILMISDGSKELFAIKPNGEITGSIESVNEAGRLFMESLRIHGSSLIERIKILEDRLLEVDLKLASIEDVAHGEFGKEITEIRRIIAGYKNK